ncbi:hypothetical protein NHH03_07565 [Stieleria sp. TO1_6]|uniref:hypothetical protein n=1 Tax=Stieleria tagensis TaxID=2956795 RepID=UPI00209A7284|nr:hypothetical protein [Stieleria tagensis]MCO8121589.1 hypothetical protein [Stieleria tagensis]
MKLSVAANLLFVVLCSFRLAQATEPFAGEELKQIDFQGHSWVGRDVAALEKTSYLGDDALRMTSASMTSFAYVDELDFRSGSVEMDLASVGRSVASIGFFGSADGKQFDRLIINRLRRFDENGSHRLRQAVVTMNKEISIVLNVYATRNQDGDEGDLQNWIHVRLELNQNRLKVFIDDDDTPAFETGGVFDQARSGRIGICGSPCLIKNFRAMPH